MQWLTTEWNTALTWHGMVPTLDLRGYIVSFWTMLKFIPPWWPYTVLAGFLLHVLNPFSTPLIYPFTNPIECSSSTLPLILMACILDIYQTGKLQGKWTVQHCTKGSHSCRNCTKLVFMWVARSWSHIPCGKGEKDCNISSSGGKEEACKSCSRSSKGSTHTWGLKDKDNVGTSGEEARSE